jgi:hypothetical protein
MWNDFYRWMTRHSDAISWFFIGWLCMGALQNLAMENYIWAAVNAVLAYINYMLVNLNKF